MSTHIVRNHHNGHRAVQNGNEWSCNCGADGTQPDDQRAHIAAQQHVRHPNRQPNVI